MKLNNILLKEKKKLVVIIGRRLPGRFSSTVENPSLETIGGKIPRSFFYGTCFEGRKSKNRGSPA